MRLKHPHCAARAAWLLWHHMAADVRSVRAGDAWLQRWTPYVEWEEEWTTRRCAGRECVAAGAPAALSREEGTSPLLNVPVPRDGGVPVELAMLLGGLAAPERRGDDPVCDGLDCDRCVPTGVRCPCGARRCGGKAVGHRLQPVVTRKGIWPPPEILIVALGRARGGGVKVQTRVRVPEGTFPVFDLFARPPGAAGGEPQPTIAHYST